MSNIFVILMSLFASRIHWSIEDCVQFGIGATCDDLCGDVVDLRRYRPQVIRVRGNLVNFECELPTSVKVRINNIQYEFFHQVQLLSKARCVGEPLFLANPELCLPVPELKSRMNSTVDALQRPGRHEDTLDRKFPQVLFKPLPTVSQEGERLDFLPAAEIQSVTPRELPLSTAMTPAPTSPASSHVIVNIGSIHSSDNAVGVQVLPTHIYNNEKPSHKFTSPQPPTKQYKIQNSPPSQISPFDVAPATVPEGDDGLDFVDLPTHVVSPIMPANTTQGTTTFIVIGICSASVVILLLLVSFLCYRKRQLRPRNEEKQRRVCRTTVAEGQYASDQLLVNYNAGPDEMEFIPMTSFLPLPATEDVATIRRPSRRMVTAAVHQPESAAESIVNLAEFVGVDLEGDGAL